MWGLLHSALGGFNETGISWFDPYVNGSLVVSHKSKRLNFRKWFPVVLTGTHSLRCDLLPVDWFHNMGRCKFERAETKVKTSDKQVKFQY